MIASCPSRDQLSGYTLGLLSEDTAEQIADHVEHCPACNETVVALETQPDTVIAILRQTAPADPLSDETACQQAIAIIQAYCRDPTRPGRRFEPTAESESEASDPRLSPAGSLAKAGWGRCTGHYTRNWTRSLRSR